MYSGCASFTKTITEAVHQRISELKQRKEELARTIGDNVEGDELRRQLADNTQNLRQMATSLPQLQEQKKCIDMHLAIATRLLHQINARDMNLYVTLEDGITSGITQDKGEILKILKENKGTPEDNLRLYLIYYLNKDSVSAAEAEEIESALPPDTPYLASTSFIKKYGLLHSLCCKLISIEQKHFRLASPIRNQFHRPSNMGLCQKSVSSSLVC